MPSADRLIDQGSRRGHRALNSLADEYRDRRVAMGLSQIEVAGAAGMSRRSYQRAEHGTMLNLTIIDASRVAAVLGLDLAVRAYPGANSIRAAAHGERLASVMAAVGPPLTYRTEVPLPQKAERPFEQRAWDAVVFGLGRRTGFEMEMRIRDAQALERRVELKRRDDPVESVVLLLADTKHNRRVLRDHPELFPGQTRLTFRELARILRSGQHPPSALVLV